MLKKRLVGVVTIKNGWAVQSFGYGRYLPLGKPECLVENLDRWGADEILVQVIDRSVDGNGPDFALLKRLGSLGLETPLIYGGGIRTVSDGIQVIQCGADRLVVDALMRDNLPEVQGLSERLGAQAVIASIPLSWQDGQVQWFDYRNQTSTAMSDEVLSTIESGIVSEVLIVDYRHEGQPNGFDRGLVDRFPLQDIPLIVFGGVSEPEQINELLLQSNIVAVAIGNFLSYQEHSIQKYKQAFAGLPLRPPVYESKYSLLANV